MRNQILILIGAVLLASVANGIFWSHFYVQPPIKRIEWQCIVCSGVVVPLTTQKPLEKAQVNKSIPIKEKISSDIVAQQTDPTDIEIARYIKSKSWKYEDAIRLAKSENYWNLTGSFNCSRIHTNKDGSVDYGIFQINSIHSQTLSKLGMTMEDMKNCYKNIDYAYKMWSDQGGFQAWSAWTNKSYLNHSVIEL